jgi:hypothetical protein
MADPEMSLRVVGKDFCAHAVFRKIDGEWKMVHCAPILKAIIGSTPVPDIGRQLKAKGCRWQWLKK